MLAILSPAKTLDEKPVTLPVAGSIPLFAAEAWQLVGLLRQRDATQLAALMQLSPALASLNVDRFRRFKAELPADEGKVAALLYRGDTYAGLQADRWQEAEWQRAQQSLAILSGLYGLLRPLDRIQPYRLEMSTRLPNAQGKDLYAFWGDRLRQTLARWAGERRLINLASEEYSKAVQGLPMLTPVFLEPKGDRLQVIGLLAKRARGRMADFIIRHRLQEVQALQTFQADGYRYRADLSSDDRYCFVRDPAALNAS
ncbi:MAG: peroxide stress protein YaaA [Magnetococcales bacterium]|nr:peroxide stress protein YaaA [Magnetococcales bacterium]